MELDGLRHPAPRGVRRLQERQALVLEEWQPIIAGMARCIDGKARRRLVAEQRQLRTRLTGNFSGCRRLKPGYRSRRRGAKSGDCN